MARALRSSGSASRAFPWCLRLCACLGMFLNRFPEPLLLFLGQAPRLFQLAQLPGSVRRPPVRVTLPLLPQCENCVRRIDRFREFTGRFQLVDLLLQSLCLLRVFALQLALPWWQLGEVLGLGRTVRLTGG